MQTPWIDQAAGGVLLHVAFLTVAVAFLVRDVLWLRGLSILAYSLFAAVALRSAAAPAWSVLAWYGGFIAINAAHALWLLAERHIRRLDPEGRRLAAVAFPALDRVTVKRLLDRGRWHDLEPGTCLTRAGQMPEALWVLLDGSVDVVVRGRKVAQVGPGHFVGEMSFVTGETASADTFVSEEVRAFAWPRQRLERVCRREPAAREALYAALGPDLARKILDVSHRPAPDEMAPAQRPAHGAPSRPVGAAAHFGGDGAS